MVLLLEDIVDRKCRVVFADRFHRIDWEQQVARIKEATDRYGRPPVLVDSTGAGEPIFEFLRRAGVYARAYPFTQRSKAALVDSLAILFEKKRIVLPEPRMWPEAIDELEDLEYSVTDAGSVRTNAPAGIHDDIVMALSLATWTPGKHDPDAKPEDVKAALVAIFGGKPKRQRPRFRFR